ncbi:MAG: hypothetical protein WKF79_06125 [Nocardioides sp.]
MRILRLVLVSTLVGIGLTVFAPAPIASADTDDCQFFACDDDGDVIITPTDPGGPGNPGGDPGDDTGTTGPATCTFGGETIPCTNENGIWNSGMGCYLQLAPGGGGPPPAGHPTGAWYWCVAPGATNTVRTLWRDNPLAELPSPAEVAQTAVERMNLEPIEIGIVPEDGADRLGLVGLPAWMWVKDPGPNTYGPITESATAGTVTVTATARVDSIVWDMGDGTTVTCTTDGTPYEDRFGDSDSPDCGHRYETTSWDQPGHKFTVTATTQWTVEWEGGGQAGVIPIDHTDQTQIRVGELQILTQ